MENDNNMENNMELDDLLEQRIMENFSQGKSETAKVSNEKLKEMNKKLPAWSLEPTFGFLK
jgi:hypothetical protein